MTSTVDTYAIVSAVPDPELPMLTIADLGILRGVDRDPGGTLVVMITPTYSGCPAMHAISSDIRAALARAGESDVDVRTVLRPAWSTDMITEAGRAKLAAAGIAPPAPVGGPVPVGISVRCPRCSSPETEEISRFSSTACKALWRCRACGEPFDRVKPL